MSSFGSWVLGSGLRFSVEVVGFYLAQELEFRVSAVEFWVPGFGFKVQHSRFRVQFVGFHSLGFRVSSFGSWVWI